MEYEQQELLMEEALRVAAKKSIEGNGGDR
jgi:hypothetical protein